MTQYFVYDVFTNTPFGGNQLAVFPDAQDISEDKLQSIAAEFNFSEVTFIYPPRDPEHTARVRIFSPNTEVDFAGHPTIGTLIALSDIGLKSPMTLELGIGPIVGKVSEQGASFTARQPLEIISRPSIEIVAAALGLPERVVTVSTHAPIIASLGLPFVIVELESSKTLSNCQPNIEAIREGAIQHPESHDFALFAYVRDGNKIKSRMFAPLDNIPEDPATGSASATLAALLSQIFDAPQRLTFSQGVDMGRPSTIQVTTLLNPLSVTVSGQAVKMMTGQFML